MNSPTVSIIMPALNCALTIVESINSVLAQTFLDWELLVVDNGSTDETLSLIYNLSNRHGQIKVLTCQVPGAASARNMAIRRATGRYVAFLDSDDTWVPTKLERQLLFMENSGARLICSDYNVIGMLGEIRGEFRVNTDIISERDLLKSCAVGCLTVLIDFGGVAPENRPLMPNIGKEDYAYWFVLMRFFNSEFHVFPEKLASYRITESSVSSNKIKEVVKQWRVYRGFIRLPLTKSCYYVLFYILMGLRKRYSYGSFNYNYSKLQFWKKV